MAEFVPLISHQGVFLCSLAVPWAYRRMDIPCPAVSRISSVTASSSTTNCLRYLHISLDRGYHRSSTHESSIVGLYPLKPSVKSKWDGWGLPIVKLWCNKPYCNRTLANAFTVSTATGRQSKYSPPLPTTTNFRSLPLLDPAEPGGILLASIDSASLTITILLCRCWSVRR